MPTSITKDVCPHHAELRKYLRAWFAWLGFLTAVNLLALLLSATQQHTGDVKNVRFNRVEAREFAVVNKDSQLLTLGMIGTEAQSAGLSIAGKGGEELVRLAAGIYPELALYDPDGKLRVWIYSVEGGSAGISIHDTEGSQVVGLAAANKEKRANLSVRRPTDWWSVEND